jgi:hypothetical protein
MYKHSNAASNIEQTELKINLLQASEPNNVQHNIQNDSFLLL